MLERSSDGAAPRPAARRSALLALALLAGCAGTVSGPHGDGRVDRGAAGGDGPGARGDGTIAPPGDGTTPPPGDGTLPPIGDGTTPPVGDGAPADRGAADAPPADRAVAPTADSGGATTCAGVSCSGHGSCTIDGAGQAVCECELYYKAQGLDCVPACDGVTCQPNEVCVPGHHGLTDPLCVRTCDCSNCGNCGLADIPSFGVSYCGNPAGAPATVTCNLPCGPGEGCIPYSPAICWPAQGCLSL